MTKQTSATSLTLTDNDVTKIEQIILAVNETVLKDTIKLDGKTLRFDVVGTDRDGMKAIKALQNAGLNWYSDGDFSTDENYVQHYAGAERSQVLMTLRDGGMWV